MIDEKNKWIRFFNNFFLKNTLEENELKDRKPLTSSTRTENQGGISISYTEHSNTLVTAYTRTQDSDGKRKPITRLTVHVKVNKQEEYIKQNALH